MSGRVLPKTAAWRPCRAAWAAVGTRGWRRGCGRRGWRSCRRLCARLTAFGADGGGDAGEVVSTLFSCSDSREAGVPTSEDYRRPEAIRVAAGSRRSIAIAMIPTTGPPARIASAAPHPAASTTVGTSRIVRIVSRNPTHVYIVSAVPTNSGSPSSVTAVLYCALSAIIANPQTRHTAVSTSG